MLLRRSASEDVEANLKPIVDFSMYLVVFSAQLFRRNFLFKGFGLGGSAIFVGAANIECRSSSSFVVSADWSKLRLRYCV